MVLVFKSRLLEGK